MTTVKKTLVKPVDQHSHQQVLLNSIRHCDNTQCLFLTDFNVKTVSSKLLFTALFTVCDCGNRLANVLVLNLNGLVRTK